MTSPAAAALSSLSSTRRGLLGSRDSDVSAVTEVVVVVVAAVDVDVVEAVVVVAVMTRNVVGDVVEDQTSHCWPGFSEASAAEIRCDPSLLILGESYSLLTRSSR